MRFTWPLRVELLGSGMDSPKFGSPGRAKDSVFSRTYTPFPVAYPNLVQCVPWFFLPGIKRPDLEAHYSHPFNAEAKNEYKYTYIPPACLHDVHRTDCTTSTPDAPVSIANWRHGKEFPFNSWYSLSWLTLILLTWRIWWAPNNTSRWDLTRCLKG